jgi:transcription antitermination factor NusG
VDTNAEPAVVLPPAQQWGAAHTRSRCEKQVAEYLDQRGVAIFLPLIKRRNAGHREIRFFQVPLFAGYVFFDTEAIVAREVFECRKVARILRTDDPDRLRGELANLAVALQGDEALFEARYGEVGKPVRVARGRLKGLVGEVVRLEGRSRLIIRVSFIGRSACLDVDESLVESAL